MAVKDSKPGDPLGVATGTTYINTPPFKDTGQGHGGVISGTLNFGSTGTGTPPTDPLSLLTGDQRNAYSAVLAIFNQYNLGSLAPKILQFVQQGFGSDTISQLLQETPEWQRRFAANAQRLKAGLPVLSPADYLNTEQSYRNILQAAGLPKGFYDSTDDFTNWIAKDVSPTELNSRVQVGKDLLYNAPQQAKDLFYQYSGADAGHALAYILDPSKATPLIQQQYAAAQVGGAAAQQGLGISQQDATNLANAGISQQQALQGFGQIGALMPAAQTLSGIYGSQYSQQDAEAETFGTAGAAQATLRRKGLASQERAAFGGSSGVNQSSVSAPSVSG